MQIIGSYVQGDSRLHRMDARVKTGAYLLLAAASLSADSLPGIVLLFLLLSFSIRLSGLSLRQLLYGFCRMKWFFLMLLLFNTFFSTGQDPWFSFWIFRPGREGLLQGLSISYHMALFLFLGNLLTMTTTPSAVTKALTGLLFPLSRLGLPVRQIALILSTALQFIPILSDEAQAIKNAQTARGACFEASGIKERAKAIRPLVIPVFLAAFHRADELSDALEARGWRPKLPGPIRRHPVPDPIPKKDLSVLLLTAAASLCIFFI